MKVFIYLAMILTPFYSFAQLGEHPTEDDHESWQEVLPNSDLESVEGIYTVYEEQVDAGPDPDVSARQPIYVTQPRYTCFAGFTYMSYKVYYDDGSTSYEGGWWYHGNSCS